MNIVVLAGGTSTERSVSLISGNGVYNALKENGHNVVLLDVYLGTDNSKSCQYLFDNSVDLCKVGENVFDNDIGIEELTKLRKQPELGFFGPRVLEICRAANIVFLALHGVNGEDGKVQATFDLLNIRYTGTDYISSALAMDKYLTKIVFEHVGIPTPEMYNINFAQNAYDVDFPCVVKASHGGSSVGTYFANSNEELVIAIDKVKKYENDMVVERYVEGTEYTVAVIDGKAYPIVQIQPIKGKYDFINKYTAGNTREICPAPISEELTLKIQSMAVKAYNALGIKKYARLDFIVDCKNNIYCLEANTLPGMTPTSLIPQEAKAMGISYEELCDLLISLSCNGEDVNGKHE